MFYAGSTNPVNVIVFIDRPGIGNRSVTCLLKGAPFQQLLKLTTRLWR